MKQYLLSVIQPVGEPPAPEKLAEITRDLEAFHEELKAAGAWVFAGGLHSPSTATVVRVKGGDVLMTDGPYTESKEFLGGICVVRAPDLDAALAWGAKATRATTLPIEVRPFFGETDG
ncbi:YciI family protein [Streptomyces sp. PSRA5]|uniref:YciI family protein n=1 Tax=Streptomyces panacea TaxID=3035064 RepID=UPI00339C17A1